MENVLRALALLLPSLIHPASPDHLHLPAPAGPAVAATPAHCDIKCSAKTTVWTGWGGVGQWKNCLTLLINIAVVPGES